MTKALSGIIWAAGLGLTLAGCSGGEDAADSDGTEAADSGDADAPHGAYLTDDGGQFTREIGETAMANVNDRLASKHADGGPDIHILITGSTNGEDSDAAAETARAGTDAEALIYIAVDDEEVAVVGENIDQREGDGAANAITTAFDNGNFENGLLNGITATEMHMDE